MCQGPTSWTIDRPAATLLPPPASSQTGMTQLSMAALDELAIQRAKSGDLDALERIYRAYEGVVYSVARRICRTPEEAEEVLQETFLEICRSMRRFRGTGPGSLTAWVKRVASSKALIRIRYEKYRDTEELVEDVKAGRKDQDVTVSIDLETALQQLSDTARAVVWLHDVEGYTHEEIAEMMNKTVSFSKSQLSRAHARLRKMLGEEVRC